MGLIGATEYLARLYPKGYSMPFWFTKSLTCYDELSAELLYNNIPFDNLFDEIIKSEASPGLPYANVKSRNDKLLDTEYRETIKWLVVSRLKKLSQIDGTDEEYLMGEINELNDPFDSVEKSYADPVRIFIKNEPHTLKKISEGKYRLISSVSLVDQVIERLLHSQINNTEIDNWEDIPSMPGIGLTTDEDFKKIAQLIKEIQKPIQTDVSGWDWSVQHWELMTEMLTRLRLFANVHPLFRSVLLSRAYLVSFSLYSLSNGELYSMEGGGVQLSGSYLTSSGNSRMRILIHVLANRRFGGAIAMGDDCIDSGEDLVARYANFGHTLKFAEPCTNEIEFCSHIIKVDQNRDYITHYPINPGKSMCNLLNQKPSIDSPQMLEQFLEFIRHHPNYDQLVDEVGRDPFWRKLLDSRLQRQSIRIKFDLLVQFPTKMTKAVIQRKRYMSVQTPKSIFPVDKPRRKMVLKQRTAFRDKTKGSYSSNKPVRTETIQMHENFPYREINETTLVEPRVGLNNRVHLSREKFKVKHNKNGVRISGSCLISELKTSIGTVAQAAIQIPLHPALMNSWQLARMAQNYQKFKFQSVVCELVSALATTNTGNIFGAIFPSNETLPPITGLPLKKFMQSNPSYSEVACWERLTISMPKSDFLNGYNMVLSDDYTTSVQGSIVLGATNLSNVYVGDVMVHYTVDLHNMTSPNVSDLSGSLIQALAPTAASLGAGSPYQYVYAYIADSTSYTYWAQYPGVWQINFQQGIGSVYGFPASTIPGGCTVFMSVYVTTTTVTLSFYNSYTGAFTRTNAYTCAGGVTLANQYFYGFWLCSGGLVLPSVVNNPPVELTPQQLITVNAFNKKAPIREPSLLQRQQHLEQFQADLAVAGILDGPIITHPPEWDGEESPDHSVQMFDTDSDSDMTDDEDTLMAQLQALKIKNNALRDIVHTYNVYSTIETHNKPNNPPSLSKTPGISPGDHNNEGSSTQR
jgi:hypothetical protein